MSDDWTANSASHSAPAAVTAPAKPSRAALTSGLTAVLAKDISAHGPLKITHRRFNPRSSTYAGEIVQVRFADDTRLQLLCKYSHGEQLAPPTPHRGLEYEGQVYAQVLLGAPLSLPEYFGGFTDSQTGTLVFVMRFYRDAVTAAQACEQGGLVELIRWMADFHGWGESQVARPEWRFVAHYDEAYYRLWLTRTLELARPWAERYAWLPAVAAAYEERIPVLLAQQPTLIHGEFTTRNSLWADGRIMPIDWETAAIAPAEIDLAVFTYDWDVADSQPLVAAYVQRRWGGTPPENFAEVLLAARLYVNFHWLFGSAQPIGAERMQYHLDDMERELGRFGVITA